MAKLIIRDGKGEERVHEISDDVTTFGRSSANIVQIKDEKSSRQHCRIERAGEGFRLVDLGSRNGTGVNGVKVSSQTLRPGDVVEIGACRITFDEKMQVSADELGATVPVSDETVEKVAASEKTEGSASPRFVLEITEGEGTGKRVELGVDPVTIGRNASNKLQIGDESASNYHAEVAKEAIGYVISDLGSTNGTRVNGEKIVKSPLAHGARIQIGSTVITFKNLGAPTEEDAVFGTVVLDSDRLDRELAAARSGGGGAARFLAGVFVVGLVALGGYGVARLFKATGEGNGDKPVGDVPNYSFREGTDPDGSPKSWKIFSPDPRNLVMVDTATGREKGDEVNPKFSVKFQRDEGAKANALMACQQSKTFDVDKGAGYRATAHLLCPGAQGLYGLRLTWVGSGTGARELHQYARISGAHPQWKEVKLEARPPRWASRLRLAVVAMGNSGDVWFDDVGLEKIELAEAPDAEEVVEYKAVSASLDLAGRVSVERSREAAISGLIVAAGQGDVLTDQSLASVERGFPRAEGERRLFRGSIFDFSQLRSFNYDMTVSKGAEGVAVQYTFSTLEGELSLDSLALRFVIEPKYAASPEIYTAGGRTTFAKGKVAGVSELILKAAEDRDLVLSFNRPAELNMTPLGEKKELTVVVARNPSLSAASAASFSMEFASISTRATADKEQAFKAVFALYDGKKWASFPAAAEAVRRKYPDAAAEIRRLDTMLADVAARKKTARSRADLAVRNAEEASTPEAHELAYKQGEELLEALEREWAGTELEDHVKKCQIGLKDTLDKRRRAEEEKEAREWLKKGNAAMEEKQWMLAEVYFKKVINDYSKTEAAAAARKLLRICESKRRREEEILKAGERILRKVRNYELNSQWTQAIEIIEKDPDYRKYGAEMKDVRAKLEELRGKLKTD
ncbi:MAG: FHA domain-containing protein [Planctomycetota bacterium]|jgi:pSer/pThr/pTyr-binding forkhead associated (FHA) protein